MKVTSKGQVTIPLEIRKKLGIDESTELNFTEVGGKVYIEKSKSSKKTSGGRLRSLRGTSTVKLSTDQILALTR